LSVQIKATGSKTAGPAFTPGKGRAEHLLFLWINFEDGVAEVIYNGPEDRIRRKLPINFTGTRRLSLREVRRAEDIVKNEAAYRLARFIPQL
jgi:hypothetical protein